MQKAAPAGVLSQTLASSPCIKQILSARIRTPHNNDVVMVGHSSVHLREFMPTGDLSNIIAHLELNSQILSARVISAEERVISVADPIFESGRDEIQFWINDKPCDDSRPPQIVVLSTASCELVFVYAKLLWDGSSQFIHARRHLFGGRHWPRKYGKHLAIDSGSRALAVASVKGSFGLLALKNLEEIKESIDHWDPRDPSSIQPITEQIFMQVDGVILRMDFLKSPASDPRRVVLLLIVANKGVSRLLLYRWDSWQALTTTKPLKCSGYVLPTEDSFPHLLIPSCKVLSFAIVTGHKLVFYDDITSKKKTKRVFNIPTPDDQMDKQWVQWAKAVRHEQHRKQKEDIFLIREDGLLKTTIVTHNSIQRANITFEPGHLHIRVDTAVCALSAPPTKGGDVLIACGDTTEGGVFHLMARTPPVNVQSLPNWSPVRDFVQSSEISGQYGSAQRSRVLASTGIHKDRVFLAEISYGVEAQVIEAIEFEDAATVDRLWSLHQVEQGTQLLLISHHEHTNLVCYEVATNSVSVHGPESYPQLGFDAPTLTACNIGQNAILQVTTQQIHVLGMLNQQLDLRSLQGDFLCADVHAATGTIVVANRNGPSVNLGAAAAVLQRDGSINVLSDPRNQAQAIDYLPVSISVSTLNTRTVIVAGSQDGTLHFYEVDTNLKIHLLATWDLSAYDETLNEPKISSVAVLSFHGAKSGLLICGMKTGQLMMFELVMQLTETGPCANLILRRSQSVGTTAVSISSEIGALSAIDKSAYVTCGSASFQLHVYSNDHGLDLAMDSLLLTTAHEVHNPYLDFPFNAVARIERLSNELEGPIIGLLAGITENALLLLRLGQNTIIPKQISPLQTTRHLVHSTHLQRCIASVTAKRTANQTENQQAFDTRPSLQVVDTTPQIAPGESTRLVSQMHFGVPGERCRVLLHWAPTNGVTHYEMVIIGSEYQGDGKLSYITGKRFQQGKASSSATTFITYPRKPVSAICEYGLSSLCVCAGRELKLVHLDLSSKRPRWEHQAEIELPSRATELRAKGSVIYVATSHHSFILVREEAKKFRIVGSDDWAGKARNVIPYGESSTLINLVSDLGSRILSFGDRPVSGTRPTFEATVPEAIDKIIHIRLPGNQDDRERFLGITIDGTVYMFTTLNEHEMSLVAFLEQLCQPARDQAMKNASILAHKIVHQYANKLEAAGIPTPSLNCTHARGDTLRALLERGPYNLHFLLRARVKKEDDTYIKQEDELDDLRDVAGPVVGQTEDVIAAVTLWLRKLLNVPTF